MASLCWTQAAVAQTPERQMAPVDPQLQTLPAQPLPSIQPAPQAQPQQDVAPGDPPPRKPDGFFDALNRWIDKSAKDFKASVDESNAKWREFGKQTEKAAQDAATAQKEAAEAFRNLPNVRVVEGRQTCMPAPNGSPDCQAAAEAICRSKGFGKGQSADIQTNRKCSAKAFLTRNESDCKTETVVVKAACQ